MAGLAVTCLAQPDFTWEPLETYAEVPAEAGYQTFDAILTNNMNETRTYLLEYLGPEPNIMEWSRQWCTHVMCYGPTYNPVPDELEGGQIDDQVYAQINYGFYEYPEFPDTTLIVEARIYDQEFPDDFVTTIYTLVIGEGSDVEEGDFVQPLTFSLAPVYPNPFNAQATVNFMLPAPGNATLALFDVTGRQVATLSDGFFSAGSHQVSLLANELGSGTYFVRLNAGDQQLAQRVTLVK